MATRLISGAIKTFALMVALLLVPLTQQVTAKGDGPGAGNAGAGIRKSTHIVLKSNSLELNRKVADEIYKNWDVKHKIFIPNSIPKINKAIVELAKVSPKQAAYAITIISRKTSRKTHLAAAVIVWSNIESDLEQAEEQLYRENVIRKKRNPAKIVKILERINLAKLRLDRAEELIRAVDKKHYDSVKNRK